MRCRVFVVGTDTGVGKTTVCCGLLRAAVMRSRRMLPFKPAESGPSGPDSDVARLLAATDLPPDSDSMACAHRYAEPVAPGIADDPAPFLRAPGDPTVPPKALSHAVELLNAWEARYPAAITLVEGAGGLHVPMPGGSWQPQWIRALCLHTVVVGREGLGTINHTLSTINGLRAVGRPPLGFILSRVTPERDVSAAANASIISAASGVPHLGTLSYADGVEPALDIFDALVDRLPAS